MDDNYTPTNAYVRAAFISERLRDQGVPIPDDFSLDVLREQFAFRRWLKAHDAEVTATALESAAKDWAEDPDSWGDNDKDYRNELRDRAAEYRKTEAEAPNA